MGDQEVYSYIDELQRGQEELKKQNSELAEGIQASLFDGQASGGSSSEYFLESNNLKILIERQLRGDMPRMDNKGNLTYVKQTKIELIPINDFGVSDIMETLSFYLDKNTYRGRIDRARIYELLMNIGKILNDKFYINMEAYGLNTPEKKSKIPSFVDNITSVIELAMTRAIDGKEADLTSSKNININPNQSNGLNRGGVISPQVTKKFNLFDPSSY